MTIPYLGHLVRVVSFRFAVYMESGFLFHGSNYWNIEQSYIPAVIRFNDYVTARSKTSLADTSTATLFNASKWRLVADGDESDAVGGSNKVDTIVANGPAGATVTFTHATPIYVEDLWRKKLYQTYCPASVFTGKLRLFIQAIYGSLRNDYYIDLGDDYRPLVPTPQLKINDNHGNALILKSEGIEGYGLYKDPNNHYWLIRINNEGVYARAALYDEALLTEFSITDNPLNEAYILSTLIFDSVEHRLGDQSLTAGFGVLSYSWHFNQRGTAASIVVYKDATGLGPASVTGIETRLVTVAIGYDTGLQLPSLTSVTLADSGYHIPYGQSKIFYPDYATDSMECLRGAGPPGNSGGNYVAPIYCYYKNTGNEDVSDLVVYHAVNGLINTIDGNFWDYSGNTNFLDLSVNRPVTDYEAPLYGIYKYTYNVTDANGFTSTDGANYTGGGEGYPSGVEIMSKRLILDNSNIQNSAIPGLTNPEDRYAYYVNTIDAAYYQKTYTSASHGYTAVLIIPAYNAEAVFLGSQLQKSNTVASDVANSFSNNIVYKIDWWTWHSSGGSIVWDAYDHSTYPNLNGATLTYGSTNLAGTAHDPGDPAVANFGLENGENYSQQIELFAANQSSRLIANVASSDLNSLPLHDLIYVPFETPVYPNEIFIKGGFNDGLYWQIPQYSGNYHYPAADSLLFTVPVGWV